MGVLIKGINMPERCWRCPCYDQERWECRGLGFKRVNPEIARYTRPEDCPLAEVPTPHGRLINAGALDKAAQKEWDDNEITNSEWVRIRELLKDAPTVIEAEE